MTEEQRTNKTNLTHDTLFALTDPNRRDKHA